MAVTNPGRDWVDPRSGPLPQLSIPPRPPAEGAAEILELLQLIRAGRVYSVEEWIRAGKPVQARSYRLEKRSVDSPLTAALESRQHDVVLLLLCNGYDPNADPRCHLDTALDLRAWDTVDLLLAWGADPKKLDPDFVLDTYRSDLMERFWDLGVDYSDGHGLASYLTHSTKNRPAYGWARRHRDDPRIGKELAMALCDVLTEQDREKAVSLLLWAGADPHRRVPGLRWVIPGEEEDEALWSSAVEVAVVYGRGSVLSKMKPQLALDRFDSLWTYVRDVAALDVLAAVQKPTEWSPIIRHLLDHLSFLDRTDYEAQRCLDRMVGVYGARLTILSPDECNRLRRSLLRLKGGWNFEWIIRWLRKPAQCDPAIYVQITRTPAMREKLSRSGFGSHYLDVTSGPTGYKKKPRRRGRVSP
jgi:hypothetical protein